MITASQIRGTAGAEYYCAGGAEGADAASYYVDATEPPGQWSGAGAQALGLTGEVTDHAMRGVFGEYMTPEGTRIGKAARGAGEAGARLAAALAAEPDSSPERREEIRLAVELVDSPTTGYDFTFSPVKSVSALHAVAFHAEVTAGREGDVEAAERARAIRVGIEDAVRAGSAAARDYLVEHAMTRVGRHGAGSTGRWMPAPGLVFASFFQHTNRNGDPQLHEHNATLNRVQSTDGVWRALDGRDLMRHQHAAGAAGQAVMRDRLAEHGIGWELRGNGAWEATLAPRELCQVWSSRDVEIDERVAELVEAVRQCNGGRRLTPLEMARVRQAATLGTRRSKAEAETAEEKADRVAAEVASVGLDAAMVFADLGRAWDTTVVEAEGFSTESVIVEAIAACGETSATFRAPDLTAEIMTRLPPVLGLEADQTKALAARLTAEALAHPDLVQVAGRRDSDPGGEMYGRPTDDLYAAQGTIIAEEALRRLAVVRGAHHLDAAEVTAWLDASAPTIGADQRAAVTGIASSDAVMTVLVGPAGTGKSFTMGALSGAWSDLTDGRVIGLATSEAATNVLRDDGIEHAANVAAFLAAQDRLDTGSTHPTDRAWALRSRDVVMVDEASMVSTTDLTAIRERVEAAGARLVLTGDPRQLSAVGAGGVMGLVENHAETYTLAEVRRFHEPWERDASLRLRAGDRAALDVYDTRGRVLDYPDAEAAVQGVARAWRADHLDGRDVLAVAVSNDLAAQVSQAIRAYRIADGDVTDGPAIRLGRDGNLASVGDLVQARRIDRRLGLTNREVYRVTALTGDGDLEVVSTRTGQPRRMPASYAAADAALAYASTVHAAQGRTTDACHYLADGHGDVEGTYVAATRGRTRNTFHTALSTTPEDVAPNVNATVARAGAVEVLAQVLDRDPAGRAALVEAEADRERRANAVEVLARIEDATRAACRTRLERHLDDLTADGVLSTTDRARLCADQGTEHLSRLLRAVEQAGHDPRQILTDAVTSRPLSDADSLAQVLSSRITGGQALPPPAAGPGLPRDLDAEDAERLTALHEQAMTRAGQLGERTATEVPPWALDVLGPVPTTEDPRRGEWTRRAGDIAVLREATGHNDPHRVLPAPPTGPHATERRALYMAAWEAAGRPDHERNAALLTDGQIRIRLRAEHNALAVRPHDATPDLRAAELAREQARQDTAVIDRAADLATDDQETARLREQADQLRTEAELRALDVDRATHGVQEYTSWAEVYGPTLDQAALVRGEAEARALTLDADPDRHTAREHLDPDHRTAGEHLDHDRAAREAEDPHRVITETDFHQGEDVTVDPAELDVLPEVPVPLLGSPARRAALEAECTAMAEQAADARSQNTHEPVDLDAQRRRRWVLDEALTAATADASNDYDAAGLD